MAPLQQLCVRPNLHSRFRSLQYRGLIGVSARYAYDAEAGMTLQSPGVGGRGRSPLIIYPTLWLQTPSETVLGADFWDSNTFWGQGKHTQRCGKPMGKPLESHLLSWWFLDTYVTFIHIYIYTDLDKNICCILATSKNIEEELYLDFSQHVVGIWLVHLSWGLYWNWIHEL